MNRWNHSNGWLGRTVGNDAGNRWNHSNNYRKQKDWRLLLGKQSPLHERAVRPEP